MKILFLLVNALWLTPAHSSENGLGVTINFPHVYNLSYESLSRSEHWSWAVGTGMIPTIHFTSGGSQVGISTVNLDLRGRWHPFGGAFFLGLAFGGQNVKASGAQDITVSGQPVPTLVGVSITNLYLTPHFGWIWTPGRLMLGLEAGSQAGFGGSSKIDLSINDPTLQGYLTQVQGDPNYQRFQKNIEDGFAKFGNARILYAAVRLGWMF